MKKNRLEAFSDGVLSIVITILVLGLKVPQKVTLDALLHLWPVYLAYLISFITIFMLWLKHHNIFASVKVVDYRMQWANGFFLLTVSQIPFVTALVGETRWVSELPVALYGMVMTMVTIALIWLRLSTSHPVKGSQTSLLYRIGERKGSIVVCFAYLFASALAWAHPVISLIVYITIPIVRLLQNPPGHQQEK